MTSPRHMVGTQGMDSEEEVGEEDLSRVEEEMMALFRKITGPMRRARQRKYSSEKIESEIEKIKYMPNELFLKFILYILRAGLERSNDDMRRTLTDFITSTAEIAQEQNHMIEGISSRLAGVKQVLGDHRAEVSRFVSSSGPVLEKVDTWMEDWQTKMTHKTDRMEQELKYSVQTLRDQVKMVEEVVVEGFDRQWQCNGGIVNTRYPTTATTTRRTTTTTLSTTRKTTTTVPTTLRTIVTKTAEMTTEAVEVYDVIYDGLDLDSDDDETVVTESNTEDCWRHKIADPRSRSGVFSFRGAGANIRGEQRGITRRWCDMETDGGGWTVRGMSKI